jgi:ribosomal protein S18 acetylase RimI-like enzyme
MKEDRSRPLGLSDMESREAVALAVWRAARAAAGEEPAPARIRRVVEKLADPTALLVVAERCGEGCGMALAEPFRDDGGRGALVPDRGHVSMVFVRPDVQGRGVGRELMERLVAEGPWSELSLWTRESNRRAQGLYCTCGFVPTGELGSTPTLEPTRRWQRAGA